jgi:hypothetical protein
MRTLHFSVATMSTALALLLPARAQGQESTSSSAAPLHAKLDVVRLKNGGLLRGTIIELVPGESVTIQLANGETRKVSISETTFVGSDDHEQPESTSESGSHVPYATVHADRAHVRLEGVQSGLTFHLQTASAGFGTVAAAEGYDRLCTAPCSVDLPAGVYRFAVSRPQDAPVKAETDVDVRDGKTLRAEWVSHSGGRAAGITMMVLSPLVAVGGIAGWAADRDNQQAGSVPTIILASTLVGFAGLLVAGAVLAFRWDAVKLEVLPGAAASLVSSSTRGTVRETGAPPLGATAALWF